MLQLQPNHATMSYQRKLQNYVQSSFVNHHFQLPHDLLLICNKFKMLSLFWLHHLSQTYYQLIAN